MILNVKVVSVAFPTPIVLNSNYLEFPIESKNLADTSIEILYASICSFPALFIQYKFEGGVTDLSGDVVLDYRTDLRVIKCSKGVIYLLILFDHFLLISCGSI